MATNDQSASDFADAFENDNYHAPAGGDAGGGITPPAEAVAAAEGDGGSATTTPTGGGDNPLATPLTRQAEGNQDSGATTDATETTAEDATDTAADNAPASDGAGDDTPTLEVAVATPAEGDTEVPNTDANPAESDDQPTDPKDIQRKKSWEGRLKAEESRLQKMKADLEAASAKSGETTEQTAATAIDNVADATSDPELKQAAEAVSDAVESGEMTAEQAFQSLSEDFGEGFTKMLATMIKSEAAKLVDGVKGDLTGAIEGVRAEVNDVISHITDSSTKTHFEKLASLAPDFMQVSQDPAFRDFVGSKGPEAEATVQGGTAQAVAALINEFKTSKLDEQVAEAPAAEAPKPAEAPATVGPSEDDIASASAVRGGGLQIPDEPKGRDDFAAGWDDAPDVPAKRRA